MEAFELRLWDGRIGRWLTVDPYHEFHSPYVGMGNNPINLIDPDGGATDPPTEAGKNYGDIWESGGDTYTWIKGEEGKSDAWSLTGFSGNETVLTGIVQSKISNNTNNISTVRAFDFDTAPMLGGSPFDGPSILLTEGIQYLGEQILGSDNFSDGSSEKLQLGMAVLITVASKGKKMPSISAFKNSLKSTLPSWKKVIINSEHILSGHKIGGSRTSSLKSLFPEYMTDKQIINTVKDAYKNVHTKLKTQGDNILVRGTSGGIEVEMWINKTTKTIETAYPIY